MSWAIQQDSTYCISRMNRGEKDLGSVASKVLASDQCHKRKKIEIAVEFFTKHEAEKAQSKGNGYLTPSESSKILCSTDSRILKANHYCRHKRSIDFPQDYVQGQRQSHQMTESSRNAITSSTPHSRKGHNYGRPASSPDTGWLAGRWEGLIL